MYLLPIQTKLKFKQNFEGWQDCEVIKQKFEQLIELKEAQVCASFVKVVTCICQGSDVYCVIVVTRTSCQSKPS